MNWFSTYCILAHGWRRALLMVAMGALAGLSAAPLFMLPLLFVGVMALIWCLDGAETVFDRPPLFGPSFAIGFWFGFGYFCSSLHWIGAAFLVDGGWLLGAMPLAIGALAAVLALFWGLATRLAFLIWSPSGWRVVALAASLGLMEYLRGHVFTGFPFNLLGMAFTANAEMMQVLSITGIYGLTPLAVLVAALPALIWPSEERGWTERLGPLFLVSLLIGAQFGYGQFRLATTPLSERDDFRARLVQPVIDQATKWRFEARGFVEERLTTLSQAQLTPTDPGLTGVTHLIWPEAALPFYFDESPETLSRIAQLLPVGTMLITGMPRREFVGGADTLAFNSILALDENGELAGTADKVHLVPVGEFLPFKAVWQALGISQFVPGSDGWTHGEARRNLMPQGSPVMVPLICYEAVFSDEVGQTAAGADVLLNLTNDAWFNGSIGPAQHAHHAVLRSVEYGLPLIRVANSGVTLVTDSLGRVTQRLAEQEVGLIDATITERLPETLFERFGNLVFFAIEAALLISALTGTALFRRRTHKII